jgi:hypothetical protein
MHTDLESQAGLRRLLRGLPEVAQQPYGYQEFERRALERERAAREARGGTRLLAAAVVAVAVIAVLWRLTALPPGPPTARGTPAAVLAPETGPPEGSDEAAAARLLEQERWLASLPREPAVVHVGTRAAVMGLQDRIAQLDDLLSSERDAHAQPAHLQALQEERARLVGTLVRVRYAETLADNLP